MCVGHQDVILLDESVDHLLDRQLSPGPRFLGEIHVRQLVRGANHESRWVRHEMFEVRRRLRDRLGIVEPEQPPVAMPIADQDAPGPDVEIRHRVIAKANQRASKRLGEVGRVLFVEDEAAAEGVRHLDEAN